MQTQHTRKVVAGCAAAFLVALASLGLGASTYSGSDAAAPPPPRGYLPDVAAVRGPAAPASVEVLPNHSAFADVQGQLHIIGEAHNWSASAATATVRVDVKDAAGSVLDRGQAALTLLPDGVGCFHAVLPVAPPCWTTYTLSADAVYGVTNYAPLDATKVSAQLVTGGEYRVVGKAQNKAGGAVNSVAAYTTLYDGRGRVVGCGAGTPNSQSLQDGASTYFVSHFTDGGYGSVAAVSLRAYGPFAATLPLVGSQGQLHVNQNPIPAGGAVTAFWNVSNISGIWFDKGDGTGFQAVGGSQSVTVSSIGAQRTLQLKWTTNGGQTVIDTLVVGITGQAVATVPVVSNCTSSDPNWRGGNPNYPFCVAQDMDWIGGGNSVRYFGHQQDITIGVQWNVYGIAGIWVLVEPNSQQCGPAGSSGINTAVAGNGTYSWNIKDLADGGYIVHMKVRRNDGVEVMYNEKFICVGISNNPQPTATNKPPNTPVPPTPIPPPAP